MHRSCSAEPRVPGLQADLLVPVFLHLAAVEGHLQGGGEVDVGAAAGVGVAVGHAGFGAPRHGIVQSFFEGCTLGQKQRHDFLIVDQFRESRPLLDRLGDFREVPLG
jgi:hypothetical protein